MVQNELHAESGTPAPYGRACTNCSRAKCKCIYRHDGDSCERCYRLKKDCQPSNYVRKRIVKRVSESRATQLEEKLDDLVTLLRAQAVVKAPPSSSVGSHSESPLTAATNDTHIPESTSTSPHTSVGSSHGIADHNTIASTAISSTSSSMDLLLHAEISDDEAEANLLLFRNTLLKYFPFVCMPSSTTSLELRRDRPFFWFCIMSITTKSVTAHISMGMAMRQFVAQKVLVDGERSMDILLGLLCHFGWSHYYKFCGVGKPYMPMFTQVAIGIIYDLALNRPPPPDPGPVSCKTFWAQPKPVFSQERTMEEKRAVLSMFLITSSICALLNRMDNMQWTPDLDDYLQDLAERPEWDGDRILAIQLRCHLIISQITRKPWASGSGDERCTPSHHVSYFTKALQAQVQEIKRSIPPDLERNATVLLYVYSTEVAIYEDEMSRPPIQLGSQSLQRISSLWDCIRSIKAWFDVYFGLPLGENIGMTFNIFSQISHCFVLLYKLTTLDDPSWDRQLVRQTLDIIELLERFADVMAATPANAGFVGDPEKMVEQNTFAKAGMIMRSLAATWRKELDGEEANNPTEGFVMENGLQTPFAMSGIDDYFCMNMANDQWLSDIFVSLNGPTGASLAL